MRRGVPLLLAAARTSVESPLPIDADIDWDAFLALVRRNGVTPTVSRSLGRDARVPLHVKAELERRNRGLAARSALLARELRLNLTALEQAGVAALAYKGPALAVMAYGDLTLRQCSDLDLIVAKSDVARAKEALADLDLALPYSPERERYFLERRYHLHFQRADPELHVEIHWAFTPSYWAFPLEHAAIWRRQVRVSVAGVDVPALDPESALLALCAHGAKEAWPRLGLVCDLAELLRSHPDLDWDWIEATARSMGRERIVALGLELAHQLLAVPRGAAPLLRAGEQGLVQQLAQGASQAMLGSGALAGTNFHRYVWRVWDRPRDRAGYFAYAASILPEKLRRLAEPSDADRRAVRLPPWAHFLYAFVRPVRALLAYRRLALFLQKVLRNL